MRTVISICVCLWVGAGIGSVAIRGEESPPLNKEFAEKILAAAQGYEKFGRVDDEARWAPWLCRLPNPSVARFSKSDDTDTHGRKLYYIFAKDRMAYVALERQPKPNAAPVPPQPGQVVVKESWTAEKVPADKVADATKPKEGRQESVVRTAKDDQGVLHQCQDKAGLFIMLKLDKDTPETDRGWVYGTVTADGKKVTSAGRVKSCMECHEKAPHDRLFGLKHNGL